MHVLFKISITIHNFWCSLQKEKNIIFLQKQKYNIQVYIFTVYYILLYYKDQKKGKIYFTHPRTQRSFQEYQHISLFREEASHTRRKKRHMSSFSNIVSLYISLLFRQFFSSLASGFLLLVFPKPRAGLTQKAKSQICKQNNLLPSLK